MTISKLFDLPESARRSQALHFALLAVNSALIFGYILTGYGFEPARPWPAFVVGVPVIGLQWHHSIAASFGRRARLWPLTLLVQTLFVFGAIWAVPTAYGIALLWWFSATSYLLLLPRVVGFVAVGIMFISTMAQERSVDFTSWLGVASVAYNFVVSTLAIAGLTLSARLVYVVTQVGAARTERLRILSENERLRMSSELHDVIGQGLSAMALKADLAARLAETAPERSRSEMSDVTAIGRSMLGDVADLQAGDIGISLRNEVDRSERLFRALGKSTEIRIPRDGVPGPNEALLARAIREGTTNALRHSKPMKFVIEIAIGPSFTEFTVENDGATGMPTESGGTGLEELSRRAGELGGQMTAGLVAPDRFRLRLIVPNVLSTQVEEHAR